MITDLVNPVREKRWWIKDGALHEQSRAPENRDKSTKGTRDGFARGHRIGVAEGESGERDDHHDNEHAVNPEELPQEWMEDRQSFSPIQNPRSQRARDHDQ